MNLKKIRKEQKLTQSEVAKKLNIDYTTLGRYENGISEPNITTLIKLADIYHTTTDNILGHNVSYLIDKSKLNHQQIKLFNIILQLNNINTIKALSYCSGLLAGQE